MMPDRTGVIEGDVAGHVDADTLSSAGFPVVQINTGGSCHLEATGVEQALRHLPLDSLDLLWIENVGNLICPVGFDLGTDLRVVVASVPEGHDKPLKYPAVFATCDAVVVNKVDLAELLEFDREAFRQAVRALAPEAPIFELSSKTGEGVAEWIAWLRRQRRS
jgi:hydrogenase nickel incorporation protein HypB